jgi:hypothetical protein
MASTAAASSSGRPATSRSSRPRRAGIGTVAKCRHGHPSRHLGRVGASPGWPTAASRNATASRPSASPTPAYGTRAGRRPRHARPLHTAALRPCQQPCAALDPLQKRGQRGRRLVGFTQVRGSAGRPSWTNDRSRPASRNGLTCPKNLLSQAPQGLGCAQRQNSVTKPPTIHHAPPHTPGILSQPIVCKGYFSVAFLTNLANAMDLPGVRTLPIAIHRLVHRLCG